MNSKPQLILQRNATSSVLQLITKPSSSSGDYREIQKIDELDEDYGIADYDNDPHHTEIVEVASVGMKGYLVTNTSQSPLEPIISVPSTQSPRRVRRDISNTTENRTSNPGNVGGIVPNPFLCLEIGSSVLFKIELNAADRSLSHYPRYNKDHLLNQNNQFDYGNFRLLHSLIQDTNKTVSLFANVFTEAGVFVFYDNAEPSREIIVKVTEQGVKCRNRFNNELLPSSTAALTNYGVGKSEVSRMKYKFHCRFWRFLLLLLLFPRSRLAVHRARPSTPHVLVVEPC